MYIGSTSRSKEPNHVPALTLQSSFATYAAELLIFVACSLLLFGCAKKSSESANRINSFEQLRPLFNDPPSEYRSAPLWVWNDDMTEEEIDTQLADFKEKGIGGVFVHPRPGLITPYISDRWNSLFKHTTEKARAIGMDVWIYDENSYPSGFAGGHVPAQMPESYNQGVGLIMTTAEAFPQRLDRQYVVILRKDKEGYVDMTADSLAEAGKKGNYVFFRKRDTTKRLPGTADTPMSTSCRKG